MTGQPRSRLRAYLALARVSNLPTVWTNVLAGMALTGAVVSPRAFAGAALSVSLLYCAGMAFNDLMDREYDRTARPDRPLPSGELPVRDATRFAVTLMIAGGIGLIASAAPAGAATIARVAASALALCVAILYYDARHKGNALAPLVMGVCRGLVYCAAALVAVGALPAAVIAGALIGTLYVTGLTLVAKFGGGSYGWTIAWLIAGICLVDAALIAWAGLPALAALAALGFPLTLSAQRLVSGT